MLSKYKTGLIVVDIQGKLARLVQDSETLIANCEKLIKGVQALNLPIIQLEQNPEKLGATAGELNVHLTNVTPITKFTFNACQTPEFVQVVKAVNVDTWLICGIETHICVYQTAKGLIDLGFKVELISDCVSSRTAKNRALGIERAKSYGVEISGLEMCLYELVKDCRVPEFKKILSLVR